MIKEPEKTIEIICYPDFHRDADKNTKKAVRTFLMENLDSLAINKDLGITTSDSAEYESSIKRYLSCSDTLILLYMSNTLVGLSKLTKDALIANFEEYEANLLVDLTIIKESHRNRGLGKLLYHEIERYNEDYLKKPVIFRGTWERNKVQLYLYEKFGYTQCYPKPQTTDLHLEESTQEEQAKPKRLLFLKEIDFS